MNGAAQARSRRPVRSDPLREPFLSLSIPTPIGRVYLAASQRGLVRVELPGHNAELRMNVWIALHFPRASIRAGVSPILKKAATQLEAYFTAGLTDFSLPLELAGTAFQVEVWQQVARIPFAETSTYRAIAEAIARPRAVRAVGSAQRANPLPIVIPCHRVVGSDGSLTGYAGGLETKQWLLAHEADIEEHAAAHALRQPGAALRPESPRGPVYRLPVRSEDQRHR